MTTHCAYKVVACRCICRYTLHIKDLDPQSMSANSWLEDTSKVQKYEMSDEAYNQRENTYRKYKQAKLKVGTATASPSPPPGVCPQPASPETLAA